MYKKRKLIWQIFPSFLIIILLSLTVEAWYATSYFKDFFLETSEKELTVHAKLLHDKFSPFLLEGHHTTAEIDSLCKRIGDEIQTRITVILPS